MLESFRQMQTTNQAGDSMADVTMTLVLGSDGGRIDTGCSINMVTLTGTLLDGQPYWTAVDGMAFWQPVALIGSLVVCRCPSGSKNTGCLAAIAGRIRIYFIVMELDFQNSHIFSSFLNLQMFTVFLDVKMRKNLA